MKTQYLIDSIETADPYKRYGKVKRVIGLMIESKGLKAQSEMFVSFIRKAMRKKRLKLRL